MRTPHRALVVLAGAAVGLAALTGCGDDTTTTADDPASESSTTPGSEDSTGTGTEPTGPGSYPELAAEDYTYVLRQLCFCPLAGPVRVTVEGGDVVSAEVLKGRRGMPKGSQAPQYLHRSINDIIERANDPEVDHVDVVWPDGQDWPSKVALDPARNAVDDEITYTIRDVRVSD